MILLVATLALAAPKGEFRAESGLEEVVSGPGSAWFERGPSAALAGGLMMGRFGLGLRTDLSIHGSRVDDDPAARAELAGADRIQGASPFMSLAAETSTEITTAGHMDWGLRLGAGLVTVPLLIETNAYTTDVLPYWDDTPAAIHEGPMPLLIVGTALHMGHDVPGPDLGLAVEAHLIPGSVITLVARGVVRARKHKTTNDGD